MNNDNANPIFVVDDEPLVVKAVCQSLQMGGYQARGFTSPILCIEVLASEPCALILTDVNMPQLNGIDLLAKVKEIRVSIPVIVMSGVADIPLAVRAVKNGAVEFLEKPFEEEVLLSKVKGALESTTNDGTAALTATESRILAFVSEGKTNKEIAYLMDRSIRTIENHRHRLQQKLGVNSTAELVRIAIRLGVKAQQ